MNTTTLFSEKQSFRQWWIWLIILGINGLFVAGILIQVMGGNTFGDKPMSNLGLIISLVLCILFSLLFITFRLETMVKADGIYVRFFPFSRKYKFFAWDSLTRCYLRHYSPLMEYGGWGIKYSMSNKGMAYNISGKEGLQLEIVGNKRILIGTQKSEELQRVLESLHQLKME